MRVRSFREVLFLRQGLQRASFQADYFPIVAEGSVQLLVKVDGRLVPIQHVEDDARQIATSRSLAADRILRGRLARGRNTKYERVERREPGLVDSSGGVIWRGDFVGLPGREQLLLP